MKPEERDDLAVLGWACWQAGNALDDLSSACARIGLTDHVAYLAKVIGYVDEIERQSHKQLKSA